MKSISATLSLAAIAACCLLVSTVSACTVDPSPNAGRSLLRVPLLHVAMARDDDHDRRNEPAIVGLWSFTVTVNGAISLRGFEAYHSDHTEIINEFHDPRTGNVCLGIWETIGWRTYKLKHLAFLWDADGNWIGYRIVRQTVTVDNGGNTFSGPWSVDRTDKDGNVLLHNDGEIAATRITVDE